MGHVMVSSDRVDEIAGAIGRSVAQAVRAQAPAPILLIEDDPQDAELTKLALRSLKNPLEIVSTGEGALGRLRDPSQPTPRLILLDLGLPGLGGMEVLQEIRALERASHVPVVIVSGYHDDQHRDDAMERGAAAYVLKPIDAGTLLRIVEEVGGVSL